MELLLLLAFFLIPFLPIVIIVGFIVSFVKYKKCPRENKEEHKGYLLAAVVLGIVFATMLAAVAVLLIQTKGNITFM
ncbi:MAG: hypothetical protein K2K44_04035 [Oscillospiraceae bacterium]|nr:hypothetical protein [Oscillospiraceae bacterium]